MKCRGWRVVISLALMGTPVTCCWVRIVARIVARAVSMTTDPHYHWAVVVGDTGLEPVTSSVSGKRASQTAPIALRK